MSEYLAEISAIGKGRSEPLWYRGIGKLTHTLSPSLFRHKFILDNKGLASLEKDLINRFKERALPYINNASDNNWYWTFLMQHYGMPTRLLDWSENPFVSMYFALYSSPDDADCAVWTLKPDEWNRTVLNFQGYSGGILSTSSEQVKNLSPPAEIENCPDFSLAIYGAHNSPRIVAQRGVFVIFGQKKLSMEDYHDKRQDFSDKVLCRLVIKKSDKRKMMEELTRHGFTESMVFPDLDGLSREIKRQFNF